MKPKRPKNSASRKAAVKAGFRSALEANIAKELDEQHIPYTYERRTISYLLPVRSGKCGDCDSSNVGRRATYKPDFEISPPGIAGFIVEAKGYFVGRDRTKLAAVRSQHPSLDLRILFAYDNKLSKSSSTRYSDWANKHGFTYAVGKVIPKAWLS